MNYYCRSFGVVTLAILAASIVGSAQAVTIATVPVGYAGNAPDTRPMNDGTTGYGAVPYNYQIGTYDVTWSQYAEFLNAKASASDPYGLWWQYMDPSAGFYGAISRTGTGPYHYSVSPGYDNKPVVDVTLYEAIRFANWLTNGQGNGDTESGTYTITGGSENYGMVIVPDATQRALWAATNSFHWLVPSEDEWYKAAYFNGLTGRYFTYPFSHNGLPAAGQPPPGGLNSGNFTSYVWSGTPTETDVGAYTRSRSPFGAFDMGGNTFQWNDSAFGPSPAVRGGCFLNPDSSESSALERNLSVGGGPGLGFRLASVGAAPEPSTGLLVVLASGMIWLCLKRFKPPA